MKFGGHILLHRGIIMFNFAHNYIIILCDWIWYSKWDQIWHQVMIFESGIFDSYKACDRDHMLQFCFNMNLASQKWSLFILTSMYWTQQIFYRESKNFSSELPFGSRDASFWHHAWIDRHRGHTLWTKVWLNLVH